MSITNQAGEVEFEGAVVGKTSRTERIMSDVWADLYFAVVWTGSEVKEICYGNSDFPCTKSVTVDASDEVKAAAAAWTAEQNHIRTERERALRIAAETERARLEAAEPRKGRWGKVVKGRKVPKGTEGWIIWTGSSAYGDRVGIKDAAGTVHWTAANNVVACATPAAEQAVKDAEQAAYRAERAALPVCSVRKGARVKVLRGKFAGEMGKVFWSGEGRDGAPRYGVEFTAGKEFVSGRDVEAVAA